MKAHSARRIIPAGSLNFSSLSNNQTVRACASSQVHDALRLPTAEAAIGALVIAAGNMLRDARLSAASDPRFAKRIATADIDRLLLDLCDHVRRAEPSSL